MLKIGKFILGPLSTNGYFVYEEEEKKAVFFDPADAGAHVYEKLKKEGIEVIAIYLTHGHFDHMQGAEELRKLTGAKIYALDEEEEICKDSYLNLSANWSRTACVIEPDAYLHDGDVCEEAGMKFCVIATPGHTKGSCAFYFEEDGVLVSGDTLFEESTGRTDFPTGSMSTLIRSIKDKLFVLPDDVKVFSGHGDMTTIGHEKKYNPFVQ